MFHCGESAYTSLRLKVQVMSLIDYNFVPCLGSIYETTMIIV
jgi:hypothetical protein